MESGLSPNFQFQCPKSGPYPFLLKTEKAVEMPKVLLKALFSHLNAVQETTTDIPSFPGAPV